jgi:hypothetical protein
MRKSSVLVLALAGLTAAAQANKTRRRPPPPAAQLVIDAVTRAARERDFVGLRQAMSDPFVDGVSASISADSALTVWQRKPDLLDILLSSVQRCQAESPERVGCPPVAGTLALEPSARFERRGKGWRLVAFERP